jgi:hydroxymethylglutaryl-CoA synthase
MRIRTADISATWRSAHSATPAIEEKSVAGLDEDVVTMSIEAARTALTRSALDRRSVGAVWVGTESKPYAVKPSATVKVAL